MATEDIELYKALRRYIYIVRNKRNLADLRERLLKNQNYPSIQCIVDVLHSYDIMCYALEVPIKQLGEINSPWLNISLSGKNSYYICENLSDRRVLLIDYRGNKKIVLPNTEFNSRTLYCVLVEPTVSGNIILRNYLYGVLNKFSGANIIFIITFVLTMPIIFAKVDIWTFILYLVNTSMLLLYIGNVSGQDYSKSNSCSSNPFIHCSNARDSHLLAGMEWLKVGLTFFLFTIIHLFFRILFESDYFYSQVIGVVGLILILYSFYIQVFRIGKMCRFCLLTSIVVILNIVHWQIMGNYELQFQSILVTISSSFVAILFTIFIYKYIDYERLISALKSDLFLFKYNQATVTTLLNRENIVQNIDKSLYSHSFGMENSEIEIDIFTDPNCKSCYEEYKRLYELEKTFIPFRISIYLHPILPNSMIHVHKILQVTELERPKYLFDVMTLANTHPNISSEKDVSQAKSMEYIQKSVINNVRLGINEVPAVFANGRRLPNLYSIEELFITYNHNCPK